RVVQRLGEGLHVQRLAIFRRHVRDAEAGDRPLLLRIEGDGREILQRRVIAQTRRGEELVQDRLFGSAGARDGGEDGQRRREQGGGRASRPVHTNLLRAKTEDVRCEDIGI